jgi:non-specific serine/threonine protein kinase
LLDQLRASGELDGARRRHAGYYLALAERNYSEMRKANQKAWFDLLESEHDNLHAALQWSLDTGEHSLGKWIAAAIWNFWWPSGHIQEGVHWLETFLGSDGEPRDETHLRVLEGIGTLRGWQGDYEPGRALLMEALHIAQQREDQAATVRILAWLGLILWVNGKTDETAWLAERLETYPRTPIRGTWRTPFSAWAASCTKPAWMKRRKRHLPDRSNSSSLPRRDTAPFP